jgi:transcriptional regulator with XRE-family HTH domain
MLDGHADYIFQQLEEGKLQKDIADSLGVMRSSLARWLNANQERKQLLSESRAHASDGLAEEMLTIADEAANAGAAHEVAAAKLRIETRARIAGVWNREKYGEQKAGQVVVNIGALHLDALRQASQALHVAEERPQLGSVAAALQSSESGIVDVEARLVPEPVRDEFGLM